MGLDDAGIDLDVGIKWTASNARVAILLGVLVCLFGVWRTWGNRPCSCCYDSTSLISCKKRF